MYIYMCLYIIIIIFFTHNSAEWGTDIPKCVRKFYSLLLLTVIQICTHYILLSNTDWRRQKLLSTLYIIITRYYHTLGALCIFFY